jgi:hypothetical protein
VPDLEADARGFAAEVSSLLNLTVTDGVRISAVLTDTGTCIVGKGVGRSNFRAEPIPLTLGKKAPRCWLRVAHTFQLDEEGEHLAARKTDYSLYADESASEMLFHYDYDREPANDYPQAHFQINGVADTLVNLCGGDRPLKDLHFPVGGKRFRPALEDVVEFLVVEGLADGRPRWRDALEESRRGWHQLQLLAAVRRERRLVSEYLQELDRSEP